jgi:hypothetical protein
MSGFILVERREEVRAPTGVLSVERYVPDASSQKSPGKTT